MRDERERRDGEMGGSIVSDKSQRVTFGVRSSENLERRILNRRQSRADILVPCRGEKPCVIFCEFTIASHSPSPNTP